MTGTYTLSPKYMKHYTLIICIIVSILASCSGNRATEAEGGDTISMRHARLVRAIKKGDTLRMEIINPWDTTTLLRSILVRVPLERAAIYSATHAALLQELGASKHIGGIFDTPYLSNTYLRKALHNGDIKDLGNSNAVDLERLMELTPDVLMPSPYENQGGYGRLEQMGVPIIECADYMEHSPLARAEWMRIYGILFGVEERADSLFKAIEDRYNHLKTLASLSSHRPRLLTERPLSGTWYVPCGGSTTGILYADAGADYIFADIPGSGAAALSIERVLDRATDADIWLIKNFGPLDRRMLAQDCPATAHIKARLMVCDTQKVPFFEETPFHPELLLENLIYVFHPELNRKPCRTYFE